MRLFGLLAILILLITPTGAQESAVAVDIAALFAEFGSPEGTFLLHDAQRDTTLVYNIERAGERLVPYSTYKIPHSAIALETGAIPDENFVIAYDETRYPYFDNMAAFWPADIWQADHTLSSALRNSIVWYYRELAPMIGQEDMAAYLAQFDYGNQDISAWLGESPTSGGNVFWLGGSLEISALEQLAFLRRLYAGELGLSEETTQTVREILVREETADYRFSGKTGTRAADQAFGWYVGWIERGEAVYFYVINVDTSPQTRNALLREILISLELLPESTQALG